MLNRALRTMDAKLIIKLAFFISDLHRQIERLHLEQFGSHGGYQGFTVYRGQGMDMKAFKKMYANKDGLLSFNSFLSTSANRSVSVDFAERASTNGQMVGILFVLNIDPGRSSTPFAAIANVGCYGKKE